jgi:hypothetical protein
MCEDFSFFPTLTVNQYVKNQGSCGTVGVDSEPIFSNILDTTQLAKYRGTYLAYLECIHQSRDISEYNSL